MRALYKLLIAIFLLITSLYLAIYIFIFTKCSDYSKKYLQTAQTVELSDSKISFNKVTPFITPFSMGIKIGGIKELVLGSEIEHNNPLKVSFNPWTFKIKAEYSGHSLIMKEASELLDADVVSRLIINMKYNVNVILFLLKNKPAKLLNFVKDTTLEYDRLKITNNKTKISLFEGYNSKFMFITKHDYYTFLSDVISNPPRYYSVSGIANITKSTNIKNLAPVSVIYGIAPNFDFKGPFFIEIASNAAKFDINNPFDNAKLKFICNRCTSSTLDLDIKSEIDITKKDIKLDLNSTFTIKDSFFENMPLWYKNFIEKINHIDHATAAYLSSPKKSLPPIDFEQSFTVRTRSIFNIKDHSLDAYLNNLILRSSSGSAIMINGKAKLSTDFSYYIDAGIILSNAQSLLNYWNDYFYRTLFKTISYNDDRINFNKEVNFLTAKAISDYPNSKSPDLMYKIIFNSKENELLVSNKKASDLLFTYYQIRSETLLRNAAKRKNPLNYLNNVTPELAPLANELLKQLPKENKVNDEIWQKLVK